MKCTNFILCRKFTFRKIHKKYCKFCIYYYKYKIKIKTVKDIRCPICLTESDKNIKFIKNKNCDHYICLKCIRSVFFDKNYYKNMPVNHLDKYRLSWNSYINSNQSYKIRDMLINPMINFGFDKGLYDSFLDNYGNLIPNIFKKKFKSLVKFQIEKLIYIRNYSYEQNNKIKHIKICPYCRI